jgi:hypothetical protein
MRVSVSEVYRFELTFAPLGERSVPFFHFRHPDFRVIKVVLGLKPSGRER